MNNLANDRMDTMFDLRSHLWELLAQWKGMLLFAILIALILSGAKHVSDVKSYREAVENQRIEEEKAQRPTEERINEIINNFSKEDKDTIQYLVQQKQWIKEQKEYLRTSILINVDPTNQKTLIMDFIITCDDPGATTAILNGYQGCIFNEESIKELGKTIDPDASFRYIAELISFGTDKSYGESKDIAVITNTNEAVLEIKIVLPEAADADETENIVKENILNYSSELNKRIHTHEIEFIGGECSYLYNYEAVAERTSIVNSINNVQNNLNNTAGNYTSEVNEAVATILAILGERDGTIEKATVEKPAINPLVPIVGFIAGMLIYAVAYLLTVIHKGNVASEKEVSEIINARCFGVLNCDKDYKGLASLFHSKFINIFRYGREKDQTIKIENIARSVCAGCKHEGVELITLANAVDMQSDEKQLLDTLRQRLNDKGIKTNIIDFDKELDEQKLLNVKNLVYIVTDKTSRRTLKKIAHLCSEYDIRQKGFIFIDVA